jgi:predicted ester cyclase
MSGEGVESAVRHFFEDVWNAGDLSKVPDFLAENFVSHNTLDVVILGPDQYGQAVSTYRRAVPDLVVTLEDVFVGGDRIAVRGVDRGTHVGELMGIPGSGQRFAATWIEIFRIEGGKAAEGWLETDTRRLLDQLADPH